MSTEAAFFVTILVVCGLRLAYAYGVKHGRALEQPRANELQHANKLLEEQLLDRKSVV